MSDAYAVLIASLARAVVADYLASEAAPGNDSGAERTERVPLLDMDKAA